MFDRGSFLPSENRELRLPSSQPSSLSLAEEDSLIARGRAGENQILLVDMFPGVGTKTFLSQQECWCVTPSLGICQAVLIASRSPGLGGRLSLTHFAPALLEEHVKALRELTSLHVSEGYTESHVVFVYPLKDYQGRYCNPISSQVELHRELLKGSAALAEKSEQVLHYAHSDSEFSRSALVAHLTVGAGADGHFVIDLFGRSPLYLW